MDKIKMARQFTEAIPHAKALGMEFTAIGEGTAEMQMPYNTAFIGDPDTEVIHGGAVYALLDTTCGAAVISHRANPGATATIALRVDYMRGAAPGHNIRTKAECYHLTRNVAFVRATAHDDDDENPVAVATGTFTVEGVK